MSGKGKKLGELVKIKNRHPNILQVTWIINNICSNSCSYCLPSLFAGTNHGYEWKNAKKFVSYILNNYEKSHWSISGGEPTMSPFFKELVQMIDKSGNTVGMTTNGVKPTRYLVDIAPYMNYITYSYHPQFSNDDSIIEKLLATNYYTNASVRVMIPANKPLWDKSIKFIERLRKIQAISYESVKVLKYEDKSGPIAFETYNYTDEQLKYFETNNARGPMKPSNCMLPKISAPLAATFIQKDGNRYDEPEDINSVDYVNQGLSNFKGWSCNAGLESLFIGANGRVQTANCTNDPQIGNINDPDNIKWPTKPTTCRLSLCHCATDMILTKSSPRMEKYKIKTNNYKSIF